MRLLLLQADGHASRIATVGLRQAGYAVEVCGTVDAYCVEASARADAVVCDASLIEGKPSAFLQRVRYFTGDPCGLLILLLDDQYANEHWGEVEGEIDDYVRKPIFLSELLTRIALALERRRRSRLSGLLSEMNLCDLVQMLECSRKTGTLYLCKAPPSFYKTAQNLCKATQFQHGSIEFRQGAMTAARCGTSKAEAAVDHMLGWREGSFRFRFGQRLSSSEACGITRSNQEILIESMRRMDEQRREAPAAEGGRELGGRGLRRPHVEPPDHFATSERVSASAFGFDTARPAAVVKPARVKPASNDMRLSDDMRLRARKQVHIQQTRVLRGNL